MHRFSRQIGLRVQRAFSSDSPHCSHDRSALFRVNPFTRLSCLRLTGRYKKAPEHCCPGARFTADDQCPLLGSISSWVWKILASASPLTVRMPARPFSARDRAWSTRMYLPGYSVLNSTMVAPPGGTRVVCTSVSGGLVRDAWSYTRSKISPITWKLDTRLGPPTTSAGVSP